MVLPKLESDEDDKGGRHSLPSVDCIGLAAPEQPPTCGGWVVGGRAMPNGSHNMKGCPCANEGAK